MNALLEFVDKEFDFDSNQSGSPNVVEDDDDDTEGLLVSFNFFILDTRILFL